MISALVACTCVAALDIAMYVASQFVPLILVSYQLQCA